MATLIGAGCILMFVPLAISLYLSVFDEKLIVFPPKGYTLSWYSEIIPTFGEPVRISLEIALMSVAGSLALGVPAGIGLMRYRFPGRGVVNTLLLSPLTVPGIAIGLAIYVFAVAIEERTGMALTGSFGLLVAAHLLVTMPWVVRLCLASLANHDHAAEEAAASLGATPLRVLWRVTLPAMRQGIIAAALFSFIISFENLEMTLFLITPGITTLPIAMLEYLEYHIDPLVAAAAVAQIAMTGGILLILDRYVRLGGLVQ